MGDEARRPRAAGAIASTASELPAHFASSNEIGESVEILLRMLDAASHEGRVNAVGAGIFDDFYRGYFFAFVQLEVVWQDRFSRKIVSLAFL